MIIVDECTKLQLELKRSGRWRPDMVSLGIESCKAENKPFASPWLGMTTFHLRRHGQQTWLSHYKRAINGGRSVQREPGPNGEKLPLTKLRRLLSKATYLTITPLT